MGEKYQEEYVSAEQAAWLMSLAPDNIRQYLVAGKLSGIKKRYIKDTLITIHSVEQYFYKKVNKYRYATQYFQGNKRDFWSQAPVQLSRASDMEGYLSITQTAWLIGRGRQGVQYLIDAGYLISIKKQRKSYEQTLISEISLKNFVDNELEKIYEKFIHLIDYINSNDKEQFWADNQLALQEFHEAAKERRKAQNQIMWMKRKRRKNGEIQQRTCRSGQKRK